MIDRLTMRSALVSAGVHLALVIGTWIAPDGGSPPAPADLAAPAPAAPPPPPVPETPHSTPGELVLAPAPAAAGPGDPPLPALSASDLPAPPVADDLIRPRPTAPRGPQASIGHGGTALSRVELAPAGADSLTRELRARRISPEMSAMEIRRVDAASHLDRVIRIAYTTHWRGFAEQITRSALPLHLVVDARGRVVEGGLDASTGAPELDRLIGNWLRGPDLLLPPIAPGVVHRFLVVLR